MGVQLGRQSHNFWANVFFDIVALILNVESWNSKTQSWQFCTVSIEDEGNSLPESAADTFLEWIVIWCKHGVQIVLSDEDSDLDESTSLRGPDTKLEKAQVTQHLQEGKDVENSLWAEIQGPQMNLDLRYLSDTQALDFCRLVGSAHPLWIPPSSLWFSPQRPLEMAACKS